MGIANHQLYYQQDMRVPMTRLTLVYSGGGTQQEVEEKAGLARATAKMLFRGTPAMNREVISRKFELLGAEVNAHVSETDFVVSISCFTKNVSAVLDLLMTIMDDADFPSTELELLKKNELNQFDAALQDAERVLSAGNQYVLYDGMRFGKIGSRKGIANISREDVMEYFSKVRAASVLFFTSISDLSKEKIERHTERFTAGRHTSGFALKPEVQFKESRGREAFIVNSDGATNDRLIWSQKGIEAIDDRRFDLNLIVDALGSFEGLLFDVLRNKNGWCYGAYAFVTPATTRRGRIRFYSDPSLETSSLLIPELLRLLERFSTEKDFQDRLRQRNETFKNRYSYQLDLKYKLSSEVSRDRYGIPILGREAHNKRIDAVTQASAQKVIGEVFDSRNLCMVFYGDAGRIQKILTGVEASISVTVMDKELLVE
jgi:predicted Zn-dependent peptidase